MRDGDKKKIKLGIYAIGLLMMGVIGINSSLATISNAFPDISQTMIQNLISISCVAVIPTTLITGKLMEKFSVKSIVLVGIICFVIGGTAPVFLTSFTAIMIMRAVLGIGVGVCQVVSTALAVENFDGDESKKVQGVLQSAQMLGCAVMVFLGGTLADMNWHYAFLIHLIGVIALVLVIFTIPGTRQEKQKMTEKTAVHLTKKTWIWALFMCILFVDIQTYNITFSFLISETQLGSAADAGLSVACFTIGGAVMGIVYGKLAKVLKNYCIAFACMIFMVAYLIIAGASSMTLCYIGSVLFGVAIVTALPGIFIQAGLSVDAVSAGFAVSVVTCAQNFGQFICPYIMNPLSKAVGFSALNSKNCFILAAILSLVLAVIMTVWGRRENQNETRQAAMH